jgi:hypothetical protein
MVMRFFQSFIVLFIGGILLAIISGVIAGVSAGGEGLSGLLVLLVSAIVGNPLGIVLGMLANKSFFKVPGSMRLGALGMAAGVGIVILVLTFGLESHKVGLLGLALICYGPPIVLGSLGYSLKSGL